MKKYLIKVNGNQYEVEVEEVKSGSAVVQPASSVSTPAFAPAPVKAAPAAPAAPRVDTAVPQGASKVAAPMPGTILKVHVNAGDVVKKGQVLLILEAMKMENEIVAPSDGKIASVHVENGNAVSVGDVMVSIS